MNHSLRAIFQRISVFVSVITLNAVTTAVHTNITVVWKSNNIIFTLKNLITTNLMNNYEKINVVITTTGAKVQRIIEHWTLNIEHFVVMLPFIDLHQKKASLEKQRCLKYISRWKNVQRSMFRALGLQRPGRYQPRYPRTSWNSWWSGQPDP